MHWSGSEPGQPAAAGIARLPCAGESSRGKSQCLDHRAVLGPPQPGAVSDDRMRYGESQGAAGEWYIVPDQMRAELGQEPVGAGRSAGRIE